LSSHVMHRGLLAATPVAVRGSGMSLFLEDGREILDACGGAAVAAIGHGQQRVAQAMAQQIATLDYVHSGAYTNPAAEALADLLLRHRPGGLERALFVSSGSEAMEASLKLARQYFLELGQPQRTHFIARRLSYHGATLATLAVGGHTARRAPYEAMLPTGFSHVSPCFPYHGQHPQEDDASYVARLKQELEAEFERIGPQKVIAFCAETMVGATTGCVSAVPGYFSAMREVCDRHGALLILDEIMCGMGRTGSTHAWEQEGVTPDIQAIGKGLGGGYQPIGALLASGSVVAALSRGSGGFAHGQTYQAHPIACSAALEVQRIINEAGLVENAALVGRYLGSQLEHRLGQHSNVGDIRGRGLFWAVELVKDRERRLPFEPALGIAERLRRAAFQQCLAIYPGSGTIDGVCGDHILLAPPLNVTAAQIDVVVERLGAAFEQVFGGL
jgi:adenosylmethionine-8-amino-7-oxononanoate aminotransferase